ncbi:MAG: Asp-tRNA(Asn)/Glu-tRNA(Gln) amidotransferase subunit GatC [bacterium]|nr:Asp-tRNA(Asn)/Glu-tRNA(Gln) amidotransferase subunit GatC [Candidatus Sumerlaeota bacterium]
MNGISPELVRHVALLSRLELSEGETCRFGDDLANILDYVAKLNELDTSSIPPTSHSFKMSNVFREDVVQPSLTNPEALANAPDAENDCFKVPAVIQEL